MTSVERRPLSVSQYKTYEQCPYKWYLGKVEKVWSRPAAWLAQGSAVHTAAEWWERSERKGSLEDAQDAFRESYSKEVSAYTAITPNFDWWFPSGPYAGAADIERRYGIGLEQTEKYLTWYENHPEEVIWVAPPSFDPRCQSGGKGEHVADCECRPDGTPGIELGFDIDLDGVRVRGFIDAVISVEDPDCTKGEVRVRDNKTGNQPGDDFQLAVYAVALAATYGIESPSLGDYWMGRSGKPTYPFDLRDWTRDRVRDKFLELQENIENEKFDPKPDSATCRFCDVAYSCEYRAG